MRHIKAKHTNPSQKQVFDEMEKNFKKHSTNKRVQATQKKQKEVDEEGFKQQHNKAEQARKKRLKEADEKEFKKKEKIANKKNKSRIRGSRAGAVKKFYQETGCL